jgi:hypothetical protein
VNAVVFLDVDGVLAPMGGPSPAWHDWERVTLNGYSLVLSRAMGKRVAALPARIVWLTSWGHRANASIGSWFGWERLEVIVPGDGADPLYWKLLAVQAHIDRGGEPFVWIDDDLSYMAPSLSSTVSDTGRLLVTPDWLVGLTLWHLDLVERFLPGLDP